MAHETHSRWTPVTALYASRPADAIQWPCMYCWLLIIYYVYVIFTIR